MKNYCIKKMPTFHYLTSLASRNPGTGHKTQLMLSRAHINRLIIFAFMLLVGIALVYGIRTRSVTGIILSLTSLGAGIHFLSLLAKARQEMEQEQEETA